MQDSQLRRSLDSPSSQPLFSAITSEPSLRTRLRRWIADETTAEVAARFYPRVEDALQDLAYDLEAPASEKAARQVKGVLRAADITPHLMQRALQEARHATEHGQSTLAWIRSVQGRAYSTDLAEKVFLRAQTTLQEEFGADGADLQSPPSPEQTFAFLLAWQELGGSAYVAALKELRRQAHGTPPSN